MEVWNKEEKRVLQKMEALRFPESVKVTAIWALREAPDSATAIEELETLLDKQPTPKEVVKAVQKYLR